MIWCTSVPCAPTMDALCSVALDPLLWEQHPEPDRTQEPVLRRFFQRVGGRLVEVRKREGRESVVYRISRPGAAGGE